MPCGAALPNKKPAVEATGKTKHSMGTKPKDAQKIKSIVGEALKASSGYEGIEAETIATIGELFGNLLVQNWSQIKACRDKSDEATVAISIGITVNASGVRPAVLAKIGYSQKYSDSLEAFVDDPNQEKLLLEDYDGTKLSDKADSAMRKISMAIKSGEITFGPGITKEKP